MKNLKIFPLAFFAILLIATFFYLLKICNNSCSLSNRPISTSENKEILIERSFKDGSLLFKGLQILSEQYPNLKISKLEDISIINNKITNFDISLLPLLSRIPISLLSNVDIGIQRLSENGVKYSSEDFIPFTNEGKSMFQDIFHKYDSSPLSEEDLHLTKESFVLSLDYRVNQKNIIKLLKRGQNLFKQFHNNESNIELGLPDNVLNLGSLYLLVSTLENLPNIFKKNINRENWYWIYQNDGIEFINKTNSYSQLVKFSKDPEIINLNETILIKDILKLHEKILRGNIIINQLDNICISSNADFFTEYDLIRVAIKKKTNATCPLVINNYKLFKDIAVREKRSIDKISSFRFSIREITLLYKTRLLLPKPLLNKHNDLYFSYRPKFSMFFIGTYNQTDSTYALSPFSLIDINRSRQLILNKNLTQHLSTLSNNEFLELAFARVVLHEKAHSVYIDLDEKIKKDYSRISWDTNSWHSSRSTKNNENSISLKQNHFLIKYPDWPPYKGHNSSEEDFSDHFAAYLIFGPIFKTEKEERTPLLAKYNFMKNIIFGGIEFKNNFQIH